jgi:hypothetical protein
MVRWIFLLVLYLPAIAGDIRQDLTRDLTKLDKKYFAAKAKILKTYRAKYAKALEMLTKEGDLDGALQMRDMVQKLDKMIKVLKPTKKKEAPPKPKLEGVAADIVGTTWTWNSRLHILFRSDMKVVAKKKVIGSWKAIGPHTVEVKMLLSNGKVDKHNIGFDSKRKLFQRKQRGLPPYFGGKVK